MSMNYRDLYEDATRRLAPCLVLRWPCIVSSEIIHELEKIFEGKNYMVPQDIKPLTECTCDKRCPIVNVNITECRNFGIIPVALCRFRGKTNDDLAQVKILFEQIAEPQFNATPKLPQPLNTRDPTLMGVEPFITN